MRHVLARSLLVAVLSLLSISPRVHAEAPAAPAPEARSDKGRERKPQPRPHGTRVTVNPATVEVDDGDTVTIRWGANDVETVRILGIDAPETQHIEHDLPYAQSFGPEARAFALGAFGAASSIELLRSSQLDPFGRTLGYLFINGKNYSLLIIRARLAEESVTRFGDNGFPKEAAEVLAAAREMGPLPFESPSDFRKRMRELSKQMRGAGKGPQN
ncbi:MAG: thermonuclease family protein [Myxococcota bacterium]